MALNVETADKHIFQVKNSVYFLLCLVPVSLAVNPNLFDCILVLNVFIFIWSFLALENQQQRTTADAFIQKQKMNNQIRMKAELVVALLLTSSCA